MGNWGIMRSICRLLLGYQMVEAPLVLPGPRLGLVVLALVLPPPVALLHRLVPAHLLRVALLDRDLKKKDLDLSNLSKAQTHCDVYLSTLGSTVARGGGGDGGVGRPGGGGVGRLGRGGDAVAVLDVPRLVGGSIGGRRG